MLIQVRFDSYFYVLWQLRTLQKENAALRTSLEDVMKLKDIRHECPTKGQLKKNNGVRGLVEPKEVH